MSRRPPSPRSGARRWAALGAAGAFLLAWIALPGLDGGSIMAAVAPGPTGPLPVASGFAVPPASLSSVAPSIAVPAADAPSSAVPGSGALSSDALSSGAPSAVAQPPVMQPGPVAGLTIPRQGSGAYRLAPGGTGVVGTGGTVVTYSVEVESDLPFDAVAVAARVDEILGDPRSWIGLGRWRLQRVEAGADARIVLVSPGTVDNLCYPLQTSGIYSCRNGPFVVLNADRWSGGAQSWGSDVEGYRDYLVNHEFGHFLGFSHTPCLAAGSPAPVMLQQTKGLDGCAANAWPTVTGG